MEPSRTTETGGARLDRSSSDRSNGQSSRTTTRPNPLGAQGYQTTRCVQAWLDFGGGEVWLLPVRNQVNKAIDKEARVRFVPELSLESCDYDFGEEMEESEEAESEDTLDSPREVPEQPPITRDAAE
ncbi:MAG: hypothetical protein MHM6MM_001404 [Cercozoa sp. M6MM]